MLIPMVDTQELARRNSARIDSQLQPQLLQLFRQAVLRDPPREDVSRWHLHAIAGQVHRFARPLTFTPYASARPCSARCRFCSETLRETTDTSPMAATLRPGQRYFDALSGALRALRGVPLSYSLSGLESTDDPDWLCQVLDTLQAAGDAGPAVEGSVLYTNGAGLAHHGDRLLPALANFGLSWAEWSRHHDAEGPNNQIMRFRAGQSVSQQNEAERAIAATNAVLPVKLVCVVQQGGITHADDVWRYVAWARTLGVRTVIFREFSALPITYQANVTRRYVDRHRVCIDDLIASCLASTRFRHFFEPEVLTQGYYFWNARWQAPDGMTVVFERSDYEALHACERTGLVYKLVFHANEHLCAGWQPDQNVLWRPDERP